MHHRVAHDGAELVVEELAAIVDHFIVGAEIPVALAHQAGRLGAAVEVGEQDLPLERRVGALRATTPPHRRPRSSAPPAPRPTPALMFLCPPGCPMRPTPAEPSCTIMGNAVPPPSIRWTLVSWGQGKGPKS